MKNTISLILCALLIIFQPCRSYSEQRYDDGGSYSKLRETIFIRSEANIDTDDRTIVDGNTGLCFAVPNGWIETTPAIDDGRSYKFVPEDERGHLISIYWDDLWRGMTPEQRAGIEREDVSTDYFEKSGLIESLSSYGTTYSVEIINGEKYFKYSSKLATSMIHIENSYLFSFTTMDEEDPYYSDFLQFLDTVDYSEVYGSEYDSKLNGFLPFWTYFGFTPKQMFYGMNWTEADYEWENEEYSFADYVCDYSRHPFNFDPNNRLTDHIEQYDVIVGYDKMYETPVVKKIISDITFVDEDNVIGEEIISFFGRCAWEFGEPYYNENENSMYCLWETELVDLEGQFQIYEDKLYFTIILTEKN